MSNIDRIVSGGQTGVDRAGLDVAIALHIPHGGWCPKGRKAEDGTIPGSYRLRETPAAEYQQRTEWNVRDSDATLILTRGEPTGGTALTIRLAAACARPCLVIDLNAAPAPETVSTWLATNHIKVLNIAGSRESGYPGIHEQAMELLRLCFRR